MNRRYMDFVPSKPMEKKTSGRAVRETRVVRETKVVYKATPAAPVKRAKSPAAKAVKTAKPVIPAKPAVSTKPAASAKPVAKASASASPSGFSIKNGPKLGVVEDLQPKFVQTEVEKRPLSDGKVKKDAAKEAKSKRIGLKRKLKNAEKVEEVNPEKTEVREKAQVFKTPRTPFINQDKVTKRPLSKNVYTKKIEEPKGEPEGTVTIISKPKKDKHISFVVGIIITIILGAAAGTVAFLLLPK